MDLQNASVWFGLLAIAFLALGSVTAAVALLSRQRSRHLRDVREWAQRVMEAQDQERANIARDLHDGVVQEIQGTRLGLLADRDADAADARLVTVMDGLRAMARGLHPAAVDTLRLRDALADLVPPPSAGAPEVTFVHHGDEGDVAVHARRHLYRIGQQALANALAHAQASRIAIELDATSDAIILTVTDDGIGVPHDAPAHRGLGMRSMAERVAAVGGTLTVRPAEPRGTVVTATVPRRG